MSQKKSIWQSFKNGQQYMATWPMRKELAMMFPEPRYIKATKFATRVMPAVAVMSVLSQMAFNNYDALPPSYRRRFLCSEHAVAGDYGGWENAVVRICRLLWRAGIARSMTRSPAKAMRYSRSSLGRATLSWRRC